MCVDSRLSNNWRMHVVACNVLALSQMDYFYQWYRYWLQWRLVICELHCVPKKNAHIFIFQI